MASLPVKVIDYGICQDTLAATTTKLTQAIHECGYCGDFGGASVGEEDHLKAALQQLGQLNFWKVAIKPGKPFVFGQIAHCQVIGLPGNPVSCAVTFWLLARPFILGLCGVVDTNLQCFQVYMDGAWSKIDERTVFLRSQLRIQDGQVFAKPLPMQGSHMIKNLLESDGLIEIPLGTKVANQQLVNFYPWD